jgi:hypothetical protein
VQLSGLFSRWWIALLASGVLALVVLVPGIGAPGLWEPVERQVADRVAPPLDAPAKAQPTPPMVTSDCAKTIPKDAVARTLTARAIELGRDRFADSDGGRRLPLALLGLLTVLVTAGIAMRMGGPRAGVVAGIIMLAMPLCALQSRMLTSEIGTACAAALIIYGFTALSHLRRPYAIDGAIAAAALALGIPLAFVSGGALLGLTVPLGAVAIAGGFGLPVLLRASEGHEREALRHVPAMIATYAVIAVIALLAYQLYDLRDPYPGIVPPPRQMFGKAVVPEGCYSWALGAVWRPDDDLRFPFDSTFEQIAFGTFPWGILAPIAIGSLLRDDDPQRRALGALSLAWAGAAWIANEAFQRRVGFAIWQGFPALALANAVWLDGLLSRRNRIALFPGAALLIALFVLIAVLDFGKDLQLSGPPYGDKITSLLTGPELTTYPTMARIAFLPARLWVLMLGMVVAVPLAVAIAASARPKLAQVTVTCFAAALGASVLVAGFWTFVWQPRLAQHLSSKALFETFEELHKPGDQLVIMGDLGQAPHAYSDAKFEQAGSRDQVVTALKRPNRVFAFVPQSELCPLHREVGDKPYFVVDDRNVRSLLVSNRVDGTTDKNPLREMIAHHEPPKISARPKGDIVWQNSIQLLGWNIPKRVTRGESFDVVIYYKVLGPVGGGWSSLIHIDGAGRWPGGDHKPIKDRCPTSTWQAGDYIIDRHTMQAGGNGAPPGRYEIWIGWFTGQNPNFTNMQLTKGPDDMRDANNRAKITAIELE